MAKKSINIRAGFDMKAFSTSSQNLTRSLKSTGKKMEKKNEGVATAWTCCIGRVKKKKPILRKLTFGNFHLRLRHDCQSLGSVHALEAKVEEELAICRVLFLVECLPCSLICVFHLCACVCVCVCVCLCSLLCTNPSNMSRSCSVGTCTPQPPQYVSYTYTS